MSFFSNKRYDNVARAQRKISKFLNSNFKTTKFKVKYPNYDALCRDNFEFVFRLVIDDALYNLDTQGQCNYNILPYRYESISNHDEKITVYLIKKDLD